MVEPLLGSQPGRMQVVERSDQTVHEWYEVEIEVAAQKLGVNWIGVKALYFYMIPTQVSEEKVPLISFDLENLKGMIKKSFDSAVEWFKQRLAKASG